MNFHRFKYRFIPGLLLFIAHLAAGQSSSLDTQFRELMQKSQNYQIYKVINRERLDAFWGKTMRHLDSVNQVLSERRNEITMLGEELELQKKNITQLESELSQVRNETKTISFLTVDFSKGTYHLMVWLVIFILAAVSGWLGWLYKNSFVLTDAAKKELQMTQAEYDAFRHKARETQVKLKRKLQTALNEVEDLKKTRR